MKARCPGGYSKKKNWNSLLSHQFAQDWDCHYIFYRHTPRPCNVICTMLHASTGASMLNSYPQSIMIQSSPASNENTNTPLVLQAPFPDNRLHS